MQAYSEYEDQISISSIIAPKFYSLWKKAQDNKNDEIWMLGGRGSGKSSFASIFIVNGIVEDPEANAIIYRKVGETLRESVYTQIVWAINALGLGDWFRFKLSPLEIEYRPTGQRIMFRGSDKPEKSKGVKLVKGYFKYLWFEELTEFINMKEIRTIKASILRGTNLPTTTFYSYNPPMSAINWVNEESLKQRRGRVYHKSTYLDLPQEWLGESFLLEARSLEQTNELQYKHMYLGDVTGTGAQVFNNLEIRRVKKADLSGMHIYSGLDFGFASDPDAFVRCAYSAKRRTLVIFSEFVKSGLQATELAAEVKKRYRHEVITCDSAEPRSISTLRSNRINVVAARKGPDSIKHGMKWLQSRVKIIIDPERCPYAAREFSAYEYDRDKADNILSRYPDKDNHTIDAVRYAMEHISNMRVARVPR